MRQLCIFPSSKQLGEAETTTGSRITGRCIIRDPVRGERLGIECRTQRVTRVPLARQAWRSLSDVRAARKVHAVQRGAASSLRRRGDGRLMETRCVDAASARWKNPSGRLFSVECKLISRARNPMRTLYTGTCVSKFRST